MLNFRENNSSNFIFIRLIVIGIIACCIALTYCSPKRINRLNAAFKPHGKWIYYYADSSVQSKGKFKNGEYIGKWLLYNTDGSKYVKTRYYKDRAHEVRYFPNGKVENKGWSKLDFGDSIAVHYYWHGKWKFYNEKGNLYKIAIYENGSPVKVIKDTVLIQ